MATVRNPHLHDLCKTGGEVFTYENSIYDAEPMAASDVAFLAPELVSEAEGPVPVPRAGGRTVWATAS